MNKQVTDINQELGFKTSHNTVLAYSLCPRTLAECF